PTVAAASILLTVGDSAIRSTRTIPTDIRDGSTWATGRRLPRPRQKMARLTAGWSTAADTRKSEIGNPSRFRPTARDTTETHRLVATAIPLARIRPARVAYLRADTRVVARRAAT